MYGRHSPTELFWDSTGYERQTTHRRRTERDGLGHFRKALNEGGLANEEDIVQNIPHFFSDYFS